MPPHLTIPEAAEQLGTTQKAVRRLIASGELPAQRPNGVFRIPVEALRQMGDTPKPQTIETLFGTEELKVERTPSISRAGTFPAPTCWVDISDNWDNPLPNSFSFLDVFSGAGGLSLGLEMAGWKGIAALDFYPEAVQTYNRNMGHKAILGDIRSAGIKQQIYSEIEHKLAGKSLTLFAGGFPCQGFSLAGNRVVEDPRNALYKEMLEMVAHTQPEYVLMENVPGLRSMLKGKVEAMIREDFEQIGYPLEATVLRAVDYYVPQTRERVIFIGNRLGRPNPFPKPMLAPGQYRTVYDAISDLSHTPDTPEFNHVITRHRADITERLAVLPQGKSLYENYSDAWKRLFWHQPSCTVKENHGGVNVHPELPRVLTARELARLQSFPDSFIFQGPKNKQLVQIGNAVPPLLGKALGLALGISIQAQ